MHGSDKMYKKHVCLEKNLFFLLSYVGISKRVCYDDVIRIARIWRKCLAICCTGMSIIPDTYIIESM